MNELKQLYQDVLLDHARHPRHFGVLDPAECQQEGFNPICGDRITVYINTAAGRVTEAQFMGSGCAICMASGSILLDRLIGKTIDEVNQLLDRYQGLLLGRGESEDAEILGKLTVFSGVTEFPMRVKCATLASHTVAAALAKADQQVSTE